MEKEEFIKQWVLIFTANKLADRSSGIYPSDAALVGIQLAETVWNTLQEPNKYKKSKTDMTPLSDSFKSEKK